jgi:hypothetical protein
MGISHIILGLVLLVFGRRLFWLFVAIAGFLVAMEFAGVILGDQPQWVLVVVAGAAGLLGALLAVFAERIAFSLAGFFAGSYLAMIVAQSLSGNGNSIVWFSVGGVIGAMFAALVMDWAIIILSCLVGAGAILQSVDLGQTMSFIVFVVLVGGGVVVQSKMMSRSRGG